MMGLTYRAASRWRWVSDLLDQIKAAQNIGNVVHASDLGGVGFVVLTHSLVGSHGDKLLNDVVHREGVESQQEDLQERLANAFDHELYSDDEAWIHGNTVIDWARQANHMELQVIIESEQTHRTVSKTQIV